MSQWSNTLPNQDLLDWYIELILRVNLDSDIDTVSESVRKKVIGLTAQEPFFLRAVLGSSTLSDEDKIVNYVGVRTESDRGDRYPDNYHRWLLYETQRLSNNAA